MERPGRAAFCSVTLGALALAACQLGVDDKPDPGTAGAGANAGSGNLGGSGGAAAAGTGGNAGTLVIDTGGTGALTPYLSPESGLSPPGIGTAPANPSCSAGAQASDASPFCDQEMWNVAPATRVLYSWTTAEQVEELRQDHVLLTRTETAGLGRGYAFTSIDELAARGTAPENALLTKLSSELFTKVRYAWSNAWAARMGWPGEDYGDQLLRIVLKPEAWILVVSDRVGIAVIDLDNKLVPMAEAIAHSERIGAVYFYKKDITGEGSFRSCSGGYREFVLGNEAMIEEWSLGTQQIRDQLESDAERIDQLLLATRDAPPAITPSTFNQTVVCNWDYASGDLISSYERALCIPSEYYAPLPAELATLSDTLRASLFSPDDPLTVKPGG